jgi:hypothetical protein
MLVGFGTGLHGLGSAMAETELEMVQRHVRVGAENVARQRELVAELDRDGHVDLATEARELLQKFEELQEQHVAHLERITGKQ